MSQTVETDASCDTYLSCLLLVFHEITKLSSVNLGADVVESAVGTHAATPMTGITTAASEANAYLCFVMFIAQLLLCFL